MQQSTIQTFGEIIKQKRTELGFTLEQAAKQIGITRQYLSMLEKGERKEVSIRIAISLADAYGLPLEDLRKCFPPANKSA